MHRLALCAVIFGLIIIGCRQGHDRYTARDIVKIVDFELSPDESKIAFSAITPIGNLDIWVVDIDGKNLKKLTFQDRSPTNHIARFFKKHRWRNYFEIDMHYPGWTKDGRIIFSQELISENMWGVRTVNLLFWTINSDGTEKKLKTEKDKYIKKEQTSHINKFKFSGRSEKYKITILLKNDYLWLLKDGEISPKKLIQ